MGEELKDDVLVHATSNILKALSMNRIGEAVKWLTDLMYYANYKNIDDVYLKLFDEILNKVVTEKPERFKERFAKSINIALDKIKMEGYLADVAARAEKIKAEKLGTYITPPEIFIREAHKILDRVLK